MDPMSKECAVCFFINIEPVRLQLCQHIFCKSCIIQIMKPNGFDFPCPICRTINKGNISIDNQLQKHIYETYPDQVKIRLNQIKKQKEEEKRFLKLKFIYGNEYEFRDVNHKNKHKWTCQLKVELADKTQQEFCKDPHKLIYQVHFELDETFDEDYYICKQPPYEIYKVGWGVFPIPITVKFRAKYGIPDLELVHNLQFQPGGAWNETILNIDIKKLQK